MKWLNRILKQFVPKVQASVPYAAVEPHLAQGDIFCLKLVAPLADDEVRILRTAEGLHGKSVFEGGSGHIFGYPELIEAVNRLPLDQQVRPFHSQNGLPLEMVVVLGDLVEYFIVASQTCDVSDVDSKPKVFAAILPVKPLASLLDRERLPIGLNDEESGDETKWNTIVDYLQEKLEQDLSEIRSDAFALPEHIRQLIRSWSPPKNSPEKQCRARIRRILDDTVKPEKKYLYYLPQDASKRIPEGFIDFTRLHSVVTDKLYELRVARVCTLATPYREEFASKLGTYLSRIATPAPLKPPRI